MRIGRVALLVLVAAGLGATAILLSGCDEDAAAGGSPTSVAAVQPRPETSADESTANQSTGSLEEGAAEAAAASPVGEASGGTSIVQTAEAVLIEDIIASAGAYAGKTVTVRGVILTQCMRGCQFSIDDNTGVIGIELVDEALEELMAQGSVGRIVRATGVVEGSSRPTILVERADDWAFDD